MTLKTTWESPDPNEHYTRPCTKCGRDTCIDHLYGTDNPDDDICYRCAGRYPIDCGCEERTIEDTVLREVM